MIDRLITSYLNYDSGLVDKIFLFIFIIFHGQYVLALTHICHKRKASKDVDQF